jgi:hypothetical protein
MKNVLSTHTTPPAPALTHGCHLPDHHDARRQLAPCGHRRDGAQRAPVHFLLGRAPPPDDGGGDVAGLPPLGRQRRRHLRQTFPNRDVAVQVEFESKRLKPGFHFIGSRVETRRFQAMGQLKSTCYSPTMRNTHVSMPANAAKSSAAV